jgi:hypothetical protein
LDFALLLQGFSCSGCFSSLYLSICTRLMEAVLVSYRGEGSRDREKQSSVRCPLRRVVIQLQGYHEGCLFGRQLTLFSKLQMSFMTVFQYTRNA